MLKSADSLRSQGLTCIAIDKPLRARIKALAEAEGLPLSHYLRALVERELSKKQLPLMGMPSKDISLSALNNKVDALLRMVVTGELDTRFVEWVTSSKREDWHPIILSKELQSLIEQLKATVHKIQPGLPGEVTAEGVEGLSV